MASTGSCIVLVLLVSLFASAQDNTGNTALRISHTTAPVLFDCRSKNADWEKAPHVTLSRQSGVLMRVDRNKPLALEFLRSDPSVTLTGAPTDVQKNLDSFHAQYWFHWDDKRLYGLVEVSEKDFDSRHHKTSEKVFKRSPYMAAFEDFFHSSVAVEVGAPSWQRWITEMHAHVRAPNAGPMTSMFFGRTNNEEAFRILPGEAIACRTDDGWVAKFAVAWLPFGNWQPGPGAAASLKLIAPLPHSPDSYVLVDVVPFVLTQ